MALYVYGIMRDEDAARAVADARGHGSHRLDAVKHDGISALVGPTPEGELRLRRDNILAHSEVLQAAFEHGPVLPFRFGTVVADAETVEREVLAPGAEGKASRLCALAGRAEMQVKATYAEEPLLRSILASDPALRRSVERTKQLPAAATHFERIRIGEAIAAAVESRKAADQAALLGALAPLALAHAASPPHHERAVMNAAFLIERSALEGFDGAVQSLSEQRAPELEFTLIGPMPAYSFADADLNNPTEASLRWA